VFVQLAVAGAMLLPWTIRNSYALGAPVWGRSNFGLELHVSNNGLATATWDGNKERGVFLAMQPTANDAERMRVRESGEVVYNCEKFRQADTWIATHPQRFSTLTVERAFLFWFPSLLRPVQTVALAAVTLAGMSVCPVLAVRIYGGSAVHISGIRPIALSNRMDVLFIHSLRDLSMELTHAASAAKSNRHRGRNVERAGARNRVLTNGTLTCGRLPAKRFRAAPWTERC
jgi:hypothetical protein